MSNEGKKVKVHYVGTLLDGTKFDSSRDRGEPLEFTCMAGQMIPGFDAAVRDMETGQVVTATLSPAEAYGERDENMVAKLPLAMLPGAENAPIGERIRLMTTDGYPLPCTVIGKDAEHLTIDMNHELAGKTLVFEIELLEAE